MNALGKAQSSLDFLMTYGWALLIIILVVGALFTLGIFDIGTFLGSRASGFAQIGAAGWELESSGDFMMVFKNNAGKDITITAINVTLKSESWGYSAPISLANREKSGVITIGTFTNVPNQGSSYTMNVRLTYTDPETGFEYADFGTVTGKVTG